MKREGRPSEGAVLSGRMIDRILRPLFNKKIRNNIQIILNVLSFDKEVDPDIPALIGASLALSISNIPWKGPVGGVRIGRSDKGQWILNPNYKQREESDLDLVVAGKDNKINMLEGGANEVPEKDFLSAVELGQKGIKEVIDFQKEIIKELKPVKAELEIKEIDAELIKTAKDWLSDKTAKALYEPNKSDREEKLEDLEKKLMEELVGEDDDKEKQSQLKEIFEDEVDSVLHEKILKAPKGEEKRADGRPLDKVRPLKCEIATLMQTHGSGIFQRGETQVLSVVTLGGPGDEQTIEGMTGEFKKRYMHHYNFPPYSVGETGRIGSPGRRELGHGALAERAIMPMIPDKEKFPYTIRVVSEVLSSNGSSSMASTCGSSLALMNAGVPIREHVAGIAMGLVMESDDNYRIMTDIQAPEDHYGNMDCKIAGTTKGVTACQMDVKIEGATFEMMKEVFDRAKIARLTIIDEMNKTIAKPQAELSPLAPRILTLKIHQDKIRTVIGPGGKVINEIIDQTGVKIDIEDDGLVSITAENEESGKKALDWVKNLVREAKVGEVFEGKVVKITDFGAFVEVLPGKDGLLHISEISDRRINKVEDVLKEGQIITVKVKGVDSMGGKISLTMRNVK